MLVDTGASFSGKYWWLLKIKFVHDFARKLQFLEVGQRALSMESSLQEAWWPSWIMLINGIVPERGEMSSGQNVFFLWRTTTKFSWHASGNRKCVLMIWVCPCIEAWTGLCLNQGVEDIKSRPGLNISGTMGYKGWNLLQIWLARLRKKLKL